MRLPAKERNHESRASDNQATSLVRLNIEITGSQRKELKQLAMDQDISMRELVTNILSAEITKSEKKRAKALS